jgi:hypothetical protein
LRASEPTWDLYFVSTDINNNANKLVPGTTPRVTGLNPVFQTTGATDAARLATTTLDASMSIIAAKLAVANLGITTPKLNANAVTTAKIDALAVTATELASSAVTATKIANLAVGTAAIAALAVTDAKINDLAAGKITAGTLVAGVVYAGNVVASQITAGTISAAVSMTSPSLTITSGNVVINLDGTNFLTITNTSATQMHAFIDGNQIRLESNSDSLRFAQLVRDAVNVHGSSGTNTVSLSVSGGPNLLFNSNQVLQGRITGWTAWTGTATRSGFATSTATTQNCAETLKALIDDLRTHGLIGT